MQRFTLFLLLILLSAGSLPVLAQQRLGERKMEEEPPYQPPKNIKRSFIRKALSHVNVGFSTGYGHLLYRQNLNGYSVFRKDGLHYLVPDGEIEPGNVNRSYSGWLNDPVTEPVIPRQDDQMVTGDTTQLALSGYGQSLPFNLTFHVNIAERFNLGAGVSGELYSIKDLAFNQWNDVLGDYPSGVQSAFMLRYYGILGVRFGRLYYWDFSADARIGKKKYVSHFNQDLINDGLFYNGGVLIEHHFSEYFRFTLRPSAEWASYNMYLPEAEKMVETKTPAFYLEAGISLNYPKLPRCPIDRCFVQLEHVHFGKEYRGQPIHRWQNPKYGQNHPELMRNKKRRKDDTEQRLQYQKKRRKKFLFW